MSDENQTTPPEHPEPVHPSEVTNADFSSIIDNKDDRKAFVEKVSKPPSRWTTRHKGPYYRASFALQLRETLDAMIKDKKKRIFRYSEYPQLSHNSLYLKILQSKAYLLDHLDTTGKYREFNEVLHIHKEYGCGVVLQIRDDMIGGHSLNGDFRPSILEQEGDEWKTILEEYLMSYEKTGKPLELTGLMLTPQQVYELEVQLAQLENISYRITEDKILIVKI